MTHLSRTSLLIIKGILLWSTITYTLIILLSLDTIFTYEPIVITFIFLSIILLILSNIASLTYKDIEIISGYNYLQKHNLIEED